MNTFGRNFRVTTFGESHGAAIGAVIDGCPSGMGLSESDIQPLLDRRRPGQSDLVTPRNELDIVEILSGVFEGRTLGTPIGLLIRNRAMKPGDYEVLREVYRPSHADRGYQEKYGIRDHRGGGRSSGRETASRVAAGAVAVKYLSDHGILISGRLLEVHGVIDPELFSDEIRRAKDGGDSIGGIVEIKVTECRPGLGDPVFGKLDAQLAYALMGIGAVKGVEIGSGFAAARMRGSEHNDQMDASGYLSNHAGGIVGGISTGQDIIVRISVKPTPSIRKIQKTINRDGESVDLSIEGRHDPCIALRIVPVAEAMTALVIIDALLEQKRIK